MTKPGKIITAGQHVLVRLPSDGLKIVELKEDEVINIGKFGSFKVNGVLGFPYGQSFEVLENNDVGPVKSLKEDMDESTEEPPTKEDVEITKDKLTKAFSSAANNQEIIDVGSKIQAFTAEEIDSLKKSGASSKVGQQIIEKIIAGHGNFDKKTLFSQQKYIRRKQLKFSRKFTIEYLGASQLLNFYVEKDLQKIHDMSEETLGLLMAYANVKPGGKYLLVDETGGVILYSMLERMAGKGTIVSIHENEHPNHIALRYSNYSQDFIEEMVKPVNWLQFLEPENERIDFTPKTEEEIAEMKSSQKAQYYRKATRAEETNGVLDLVQSGDFDALICVSTLHLPTLLSRALDRVGGSRPVVIYSQFKEVLLEAQHAITEDRRVLAPSIVETKVRSYQTIIGRMHPAMSSKGYGGYLLWATRVFPKASIHALGKGAGRKKQRVEKENERY